MMQANTRIWTLVFMLFLALIGSAMAQYPSERQVDFPDGGFRHSDSFNSNYWIYRSIGGETYLKGKSKERKWYCLWLCQVRVEKKAQSIIIENTYYAEIRPGVFASVAQAATCRNAASCKHKNSAVGVVIDINFPGEGGGILPIDGVVTHHIILVDGSTSEEWTAIGKYPHTPPVIL